MLDGMPEPPPRWARPASAVRLPALGLDLMLAAALPHAADDVDQRPVMTAVHLTVRAGLLQLVATDTVTVIRERRPVNQTCDDFTFLLRRDDAVALRSLLRALLRGLEKQERQDEPVDLYVAHDGALAVLGDDLDVRFTQVDEADLFPDCDRLLGRSLEQLANVGVDLMDLHINPTLLARLVPLQRAGRGDLGFRFRWAGEGRPVIVTTTVWGEDPRDDDVVVLIQPIKVLDPAMAEPTP